MLLRNSDPKIYSAYQYMLESWYTNTQGVHRTYTYTDHHKEYEPGLHFVVLFVV